jgi:hypothetical protein
LKEEVELKNESGRIIVKSALASRLVAALSGLEDALLNITDEHHRLRPDTVDVVKNRAPYLIDSWTEPQGEVYTLANNLHDVYRARTFLERAIALGRDVELD